MKIGSLVDNIFWFGYEEEMVCIKVIGELVNQVEKV